MNRNMIQQAQQLQARLAKAQAELANLILEVSSGGGTVKVTIDGQQNIKSIKIAKEVVNPEDVEMLEDLVLTAVKEAHSQISGSRCQTAWRYYRRYQNTGINVRSRRKSQITNKIINFFEFVFNL